MATEGADAGGYELAYQEARRALEDQERLVGEIRSRAGALIAGAAVTTSFFGGQALHMHHVHVFGWLAIAAFVGLGIAVLLVLWPRRDWQFDLSPSTFVATYLEPAEGEPLALPLIHRDLALHMGASAEFNRGQLRWAFTSFRAGAILLIAEVLLWVGALLQQA